MAFRPKKEWVVAVTGNSTPFTAQALADTRVPDLTTGMKRQLHLTAKGGDVVVKMGTSGVTATAALTGTARPDNNFTVFDGGVEIFQIESGVTHLSGVSADGATAATLYIGLGYGEKV